MVNANTPELEGLSDFTDTVTQLRRTLKGLCETGYKEDVKAIVKKLNDKPHIKERLEDALGLSRTEESARAVRTC